MITRRISALAIGLALALFTRAPLGQTRSVKALVRYIALLQRVDVVIKHGVRYK